MRSNLVSRRFAQNGPKTRKIHFFGVFGLLRPRNFFKSPKTPKIQQIANCNRRRPNLENAKCTKVAQRERGSDGPKKYGKPLGGAELRPKRRPARNIWFNPGSNPGPHPPWVEDRPKNPVNRESPAKLLHTTRRRQRKKVAQRERGPDEPKKIPKTPWWR